jgi:hypothetical protein
MASSATYEVLRHAIMASSAIYEVHYQTRRLT